MLSPIKLGQELDGGAVSAASVMPATPPQRNVAGSEQQDWRYYSKAWQEFKAVVTNHLLLLSPTPAQQHQKKGGFYWKEVGSS